MRKARLNVALAALALAVAVAAVAALLLIRPRTRPEPAVPSPAQAATAAANPARTVEEARRQAQASVARRMADTNYLAQLDDINERRRALSDEGAALRAEIESWQRQLEAEQPEFAAVVARLKELRQCQAQGEETAAAVAEQTGVMQAAMDKEPRYQAFMERQKALQARSDALALEARERVGARMRQQGGAGKAAPSGDGR